MFLCNTQEDAQKAAKNFLNHLERKYKDSVNWYLAFQSQKYGPKMKIGREAYVRQILEEYN